MNALLQLTLANIRSFVRDRAALFWTLAFPLIFIFLFGAIFSGGGTSTQAFAWVDEDRTPGSSELRAAFAAEPLVELADNDLEAALAAMREGSVRAVIVVPAGYGDAIEAHVAGPSAPAAVAVYTDPSLTATSGATFQVVAAVLGRVNQAFSGRGPAVVPETRVIQTQTFTFITYFLPSILAMSLMQLGIFSAVPLVADREKQIFKRLNATPLRRWQLVGSNVLMRLVIALAQTVIIVAVGMVVFGLQLTGNLVAVASLVVLGSLAFISLGYAIASVVSTEDAANGLTSVVQFPLMFLSGIFFAIDQMPEVLQVIARFLPLTYLADGLRQVMVDGTPFAPLALCYGVLIGFMVVCFGFAARFFRWQ